MNKCGFYSCNEEATVDALFEANGHRIKAMICPLHDKHTRAGGDLAVLFRRVDHRMASSYTILSGAGERQPPKTGGE